MYSEKFPYNFVMNHFQSIIMIGSIKRLAETMNKWRSWEL